MPCCKERVLHPFVERLFSANKITLTNQKGAVPLKLCTLEHNHLGVKRNGQIANIYEALQARPAEEVPATMDELINQPESLPALEAYMETLEQTGPYMYTIESCTFGPAIPNPEKIICIGLNYRRHADETGSPYPETPILFSKFKNTLTGHGSNIVVPL